MKAYITDLSLFLIWLKDKKVLADSSIHTYRDTLKEFLSTNPDIDVLDDYNDYLIKKIKKKRGYHQYYALKNFIEYKFEGDNKFIEDLIKNLLKPKLKKDLKQQRKYLEIDKIIDVINSLNDTKHKVIALIQAMTGVRVGDILRMTHDMIFPEIYDGKNILRLTLLGKREKIYTIQIFDETLQDTFLNYINMKRGIKNYCFLELSKHKGRDRNMHHEEKLLRMNYTWYWMDLKQALQGCGIHKNDWATHDFRRCWARRLFIKSGKDIKILKDGLNHGDINTTLRYLDHSGLKNIDIHKKMQEDFM